ncbi:MAG: fibrobacter succinogenes major paralogous domain-containing protein [Bacteroidales bacterium]|nr:fibrobacter succinogenes major paralogous domain-containing protein [Bacteroidales bacterium]
MKIIYRSLIVLFVMCFSISCEKNTDSFTDPRDNNTYNTTEIGDQIWMGENLAYLPSVSPPDEKYWPEPYYYVYDYEDTSVVEAKNTSNYNTYGVLYNWVTAMDACPAGWHLPSDEEWKKLEMFLGMSQTEADDEGLRGTDEGCKLKEKGTKHWLHSNIPPNDENNYTFGNNKSGFTALPGGKNRKDGIFLWEGMQGYWWSSTENEEYTAYVRCLFYNEKGISRYDDSKVSGISVRCVKD